MKTPLCLNEENLPNVDPSERPAIQSDCTLVDKAIKSMKTRKAPGPSGIPCVIHNMPGSVGPRLATYIFSQVLHEGVILKDLCNITLVNSYKSNDKA